VWLVVVLAALVGGAIVKIVKEKVKLFLGFFLQVLRHSSVPLYFYLNMIRLGFLDEGPRLVKFEYCVLGGLFLVLPGLLYWVSVSVLVV
jgi:hypothetical protein